MSDKLERTEIGGDEERASIGYPQEWGMPVGRRFSEERVQWVRERVEQRTRSYRSPAIDGLDALLQLRRRLVDENVERLRVLIARRRGPR